MALPSAGRSVPRADRLEPRRNALSRRIVAGKAAAAAAKGKRARREEREEGAVRGCGTRAVSRRSAEGEFAPEREQTWSGYSKSKRARACN